MRLAVIADIHGNLPALEAVLADIERRGIERIFNLGDSVSGPLWPRESCELLMAREIPAVRGNHDRFVAQLAPADMNWWDRLAFAELTGVQRNWLNDTPVTRELDGGILAFHARPYDDERYLLEDIENGRLVPAPAEKVAARLREIDAALLLCGHSHQQHMTRLPDGRLVVNPGSVGCPAYRDPSGISHVSETRTPHARYAVIETADAGRTIEFIALDYDHAGAAKRAEANGQPGWAHALATGFVPRAA